MNKRSIARTLGHVSASLGILLMCQQTTLAGGHPSYESRIKGVWNARVNITSCDPGNVPGNVVFASFDAVNVFAADGTFLDANSQNSALQSPHLGYWRHVRGNKYEFAQKFFMFGADGSSLGWRIVRHDVVLSRSGQSFVSQGTAETFDKDGVLMTIGCSKATAIRFR